MRTPASACAIILAACTMLPHAALAQQAGATCEAKRADISRDIDEARAKGQAQRVRGLERALRETQAHCSDAQLAKEQAARIKRQEKKVAERQQALDKARAQGKPDKIADREARLAQEQAELDKLRSGAR